MRCNILIAICLSLATTSLFAKNAEFSENRTLPPLKLSATDLDTILHEAHAFIASANGPAGEQRSALESVKLGIRGHEIEIPTFRLRAALLSRKKSFNFLTSIIDPINPSHLS